MSKTPATYWNVLAAEHGDRWVAVEGTAGQIEQLTLAADSETGD